METKDRVRLLWSIRGKLEDRLKKDKGVIDPETPLSDEFVDGLSLFIDSPDNKEAFEKFPSYFEDDAYWIGLIADFKAEWDSGFVDGIWDNKSEFKFNRVKHQPKRAKQ